MLYILFIGRYNNLVNMFDIIIIVSPKTGPEIMVYMLPFLGCAIQGGRSELKTDKLGKEESNRMVHYQAEYYLVTGATDCLIWNCSLRTCFSE